jgi:hypothetical protein
VTGEYQRPYAEYTFITQPIQIIIQAAHNGLRPTMPNLEQLPTIFVNVVQRAWDTIPNNRPNTRELLDLLEACNSNFEQSEFEWNSCIRAHR